MNLQQELNTYLDAQTITSDNIGQIRRSCFMPWDSEWNGIVRDETASRENKAAGDSASLQSGVSSSSVADERPAPARENVTGETL